VFYAVQTTINPHVHHRMAVRLGHVVGCDLCHDHPRANNDLCLACDRKQAGPRLREVSTGGATFKNGESILPIDDMTSLANRYSPHSVYERMGFSGHDTSQS
jgi:hypothetical protein